MRKTFLIIIMILLSANVFATYNPSSVSWNNNGENISYSGNVGIGNNQPSVGLEVGSEASGKNAKITGTLGSEMSPGFSNGWTLGTGWSLSGGHLIKANSAPVSDATPSGTFDVVAGRTYKVVIVVDSAVLGNNYIAYSIGGMGGSRLNPGTITDYIVAKDTSKIIFTDVNNAESIDISYLSVKEVTPGTGDLQVVGNLDVGSTTTFKNNIAIGFSTPTSLAAPLSVMSYNSEGIRVYRQLSSTQYLAIDAADGSAFNIRTVGGDKPFNIVSGATTYPINFYVGTTTLAMNILANGNVGIGTSSPTQKLDIQGQAIKIGGDIGSYNNRTDATDKAGFMVIPHRNNSQPSISVFFGSSTATDNKVVFGGGASSFNAATLVAFFTAPNNTAIAGTERMRIDNAGNVGIGTTSPTQKLDVNGSINASNGNITASNFYGNINASYVQNAPWITSVPYQNAAASWTNDTTTTNTYQIVGVSSGRISIVSTPAPGDGIMFRDTSINGNVTSAVYGYKNDADNGGLTFSTRNGSTTEKIRLIPSGELGIGTTTPSEKLNVNGSLRVDNSSGNAVLFVNSTTGSVGIGTTQTLDKLQVNGGIRLIGQTTHQITLTGSATSARIGQDSLGAFIASDTNGASIRFSVNNGTLNEAMRILSNQNVGIGTMSPSSKLHINDSSNDATSFKITNNQSQFGVYMGNLSGDVNGTSIGTITANQFRIFTNNTDKMTIDASGNVGIGTTSPRQKLQIGSNDVVGSSSPNSISLGASYSLTEGQNPKLRLFDNDDGAVYGLGISNSQLDFIITAGSNYNWFINGLSIMKLDYAGRLGIGTTNPGAKLDILTAPNSDQVAKFQANKSNGGFITLYDAYNSSTRGFLGYGATVFGTDNNSIFGLRSEGSITFATAGANRQMTIDTNGNVGIGTTAPGQKLTVIDIMSITNYAGEQRLLMGNQDSSGVNNPSIIAAANGDLYLGGGNSWTGNGGTFSSIMKIQDDGNVGIGTMSPQGKLDVNGTMRLSRYAAQPFACDSTHDGAIALTNTTKWKMCICNSTDWVFTTDGSACAW